MTDEQKATQEATQAEEEVKTESDATDEQSTEATEAKAPEAKDDSEQLKAELQREREAREKAEKAAADKAYKLREKQRKAPENDFGDDSDDDKPLTRSELQAILAQERDRSSKELQAQKISAVAANLSSNETERELIIEMHKNRSFPSHLTIEEQLEECYLLANKKKIFGENKELKRALAGKKTVSKDSSTTHQDSPGKGQPKMQGADAAEMARVGFKWNDAKGHYEKKLANGSTLVKSPKDGQTRLIKA